MIQSTIIRSELVLNCMTARAAELNLLGRGPVAPKRVLQEAISLEMADVSTPLEGPLRGDAGDTENVQRGIWNVPADEAVGWVSVPAELQYGCAVGDHHNPLP